MLRGGLITVCLAAAVLAAGAVRARNRTRCVGSPRENAASETERVKWHRQLHGAWPPPFTYPGKRLRAESESEGWASWMQNFEMEVRRRSGPLLWTEMQQIAQMHLISNWTAAGYKHIKLDESIHKEVASVFLQDYKPGGPKEGNMSGYQFFDGDREMWDARRNLPGPLRLKLIEEVQAKIADWVGLPQHELALVADYGFRISHNGCVVKPHVDNIKSHALSAVYCVDLVQAADAPPWYLGAEAAFDGKPGWVDLRPGELFLYESAKLPHQRPNKFVGERYVAFFLHFRTKGWCLEKYDTEYALPADWSSPLPEEPQPEEL